ncbi:hypothetical protein DAPPUDRAFT_116189 [Daphnia pulex]|uniref:Uncharacterized protein n=1 Tax=Daphnia pulex TaxID=6669 RepID=E9HNV6_DAPPU|nr:hypothetical protein DAPPUDRAFT_116189 [Daphnia pulex]|eukprot:EFX66582.1 hypothetical protein DAPPUDRAFT_116189 [Daphnia pulex]
MYTEEEEEVNEAVEEQQVTGLSADVPTHMGAENIYIAEGDAGFIKKTCKCESRNKMSYCPRPSHAAITGISNDEIQSQILTATESAVAGSAGGLATISAGRRIANESGKVDVSGLRQWITAKPELCQEFQALLHSIKLKEVVEDAIGLVNEDFR